MGTHASHCKQDTRRVQPGLPPVYYQLHTLLHTLRSFEQHEEELCGLLSEIQRSGKLGTRLRRELASALDSLPVQCLETDFASTWQALDEATPESAAA